MITMKTVPVSDCQCNNYLPWLMVRKGTFATDFVCMSASDYMYYPHGGHTYSVFPVGTPVAAIPVYLLPSLFIGYLTPLWSELLGKTSAAFMMALAVVFIYLTVLKLLDDRKSALVVSVVFAFGTGVFAMASQMLLTFTGVVLFLAMGMYFLVLGNGKPRYVVMAGFAFAFAGLCQPASMVFLLLFGLYVVLRRRRDLSWYAAGALPPVALMAVYNSIAYGAPWRTGEFLAATFIKTGSWKGSVTLGELWSTPVVRGAVNNLFSPSRGLLVFSPVLVFAFYGLYLAIRKKGKYSFLIYGFIGCCVTFLVASKWYDWGGGNCYGYRITLNAIPVLCLLTAVAMPRVLNRKALLAVFSVFLAFSVFVQVVGYLSYDGGSWETRYLRGEGREDEFETTDENIWSGDAQLFWETRNFKFYVPPFWQGVRPYPASVTRIRDVLVEQEEDGTRFGVVSESPRIFRIVIQVEQADGPFYRRSCYVPRGDYTTWTDLLRLEGEFAVSIAVSNVGVEDFYWVTLEAEP